MAVYSAWALPVSIYSFRLIIIIQIIIVKVIIMIIINKMKTVHGEKKLKNSVLSY